jgi:Ca-activated chloride channel family protein
MRRLSTTSSPIIGRSVARTRLVARLLQLLGSSCVTLQRGASASTACAVQHRFRLITAACALFGLQIVGTAPAAAQETRCPEGLMRISEAGSGVLMLRTTVPGCYVPAPQVAADFAVDISGPVARTRVTQRFENPSEGWVEGVYLFPLPESAAVDTLKLQVGDRFIEGLIKERQEARRIYEAAKAQGKKASLVEQERPNVFTNQVANIGPRDVITVQIEYQESLRFDHGRYHLRVPLVVAPRYKPQGLSLARLAA